MSVVNFIVYVLGKLWDEIRVVSGFIGVVVAFWLAVIGIALGFVVEFQDALNEVDLTIDWASSFLPWGFANAFLPVTEMVYLLKLYLTLAGLVIITRWVLKVIPTIG